MKKLLLPAVTAAILALGLHAQADTIADWTFESSAPTTTGPISPEVGSGSASLSGVGTISSPAGDGSSHSYSANGWAVGDYFQFQVSTADYSGIELSWDQTGSSTGPETFQLEYSTDGTAFTNFGSPITLNVNGSPNSPWNGTTFNSLYQYTDDLSGITALDGQSTVYFRIVDTSTTALNGGTVASAGTDRVDNFTVTGTVAATPEPSAWMLGGIALGTLAFLRLRRSMV